MMCCALTKQTVPVLNQWELPVKWSFVFGFGLQFIGSTSIHISRLPVQSPPLKNATGSISNDATSGFKPVG